MQGAEYAIAQPSLSKALRSKLKGGEAGYTRMRPSLVIIESSTNFEAT